MRKYFTQDRRKRGISFLLAGLLTAASAAGTGPVPADAEDAAAYTGGPCEHHTEHTQDCGYAEAVEGQPCGHQHTKACYILTCGHQHDAACGYVEAEGTGCTHVHTKECYTLDCPHEKSGHDGTCGYTEAVEGKPCGYVCGICSNPGGNGSGDGSGEDSGEKEPQTGQDTLPEAVQKVQTAIESLPSADEAKAMGEGERAGISAKVQEIKASYEALAEEERALLPAACSGKLEALSAYLENQIAAGSPAQSGSFADAAPGNGTQTCICTEACTDTAVNTGCPACAADVSRCTGGKTGAGAAASGTQGSPVEQVQALIDGLPTAEAVAAMTREEQGRVYADLQAAWDVYEALTDEQKSQIRGAEIFDALFAVFNGMTDTLDDTVFTTQANSDGTVTITGVTGDKESITALTIPATLSVEGKDKAVAGIGDNAFKGYTNLSNVTFAEGSRLKSIGEAAFEDCSSLEEISIPGSVESIGWYAFRNCSNLQTVAIPGSVKSIGIYAFRNCSNLQTVTIPGSVTVISDGVFNLCSSLETVILSEGIGSIDNNAFSSCSNLQTVTIPGSVRNIGMWAFENCTNLSDVTFAEGSQLKSIGNDAFRDCSSSPVLWHYGNTTVEEYANTNHLAQADINKKLPVISKQPQDASYAAGSEEVTPLTVEVSVPDGDTLFYQWYSNTAESNDGGTLLAGETDASYTPSVNAEGAVYYYCIVKNTFSTAAGERSLSAASEAAAVTVTPAPAYTVTVNGGSGSGQYRAGDTVTVTADAPADGQQFSHWTVDQGGAALADANSAITTFIMPAEAVTVTAHYTAIAPPETEEIPAGPELPAPAETEEAPAVPETETQPAVTAEEKQSARKKLNQKVEAGETYNRICWARVEGADGYIIYGSKCSSAEKKHKMKELKTIASGRKTSWTHKGLKENTWYKYRVSAYKLVDGEKVTIGSSVALHSLTQGDSRYANPSRVKVSRTKITLKKGKSTVIKAEAVLPKGKKTKQHTAEIRYVVSDPSIVSVSKNGKIKGKKKGSCTVYAVAQNGVYQKIKVKVK